MNSEDSADEVKRIGELRMIRMAPPGSTHQIESVLFSYIHDDKDTVIYREQWTKPNGDDRWMCSRIVTVVPGKDVRMDGKDLWEFPSVSEGHAWVEKYLDKNALSRKFFVPNWVQLPWLD